MMLDVMAHASSGFDPVAATQAYLDQLSPEARARSDAYFEGGYWLLLWNFLITAGIGALLLFSRFSSWLRGRMEAMLPWRWLQTLVFGALYIVVTAVLAFPMTVYEGFYREHAYGLATQTLPEWLGERGMALGVNVVLGAVFFTILYGVIRAAPRFWWVWGGFVSVVFLAITVLIAPVYIEPLFNTYTPMQDGPLKDDILSMAKANGVPADNVYVFDTSRQSTRVTANVSGLGGTARVALGDNLIKEATPAEVRAVMGHEIGHYALGHIYRLLVDLGLVLVVGFAFVNWAFHALTRRFGKAWGVRDIGDVAGLPLLGVVLSAYFFLVTPIMNTIIRTGEADADIFGLNAACEPDGFAKVALKLSDYRKMEPGPLEEFIFFDHPSGRNRIAMAMNWKAENGDRDCHWKAH